MNSKSDYAYNEIKNKIIQGGLAPLSDIVEERLVPLGGTCAEMRAAEWKETS